MSEKQNKKQKDSEQEALQAFLKDIEADQKKHNMQIIAVLDVTRAGIVPRFEVQKMPEAPKEEPKEAGDK